MAADRQTKRQPDLDICVEVRQSPVAGMGAFATRAIAKGTYLLPLTGRRFHRDSVDWATYDKRAMQIDADWFMEEGGGTDDYINHCCEPNTAFTADGMGFEAIRDIPAGGELFIDYSTCEYDTGWKIPCSCGAPACRRAVTGFADLAPEVQKRLLPYCLPYIRQKFAR